MSIHIAILLIGIVIIGIVCIIIGSKFESRYNDNNIEDQTSLLLTIKKNNYSNHNSIIT